MMKEAEAPTAPDAGGSVRRGLQRRTARGLNETRREPRWAALGARLAAALAALVVAAGAFNPVEAAANPEFADSSHASTSVLENVIPGEKVLCAATTAASTEPKPLGELSGETAAVTYDFESNGTHWEMCLYVGATGFDYETEGTHHLVMKLRVGGANKSVSIQVFDVGPPLHKPKNLALRQSDGTRVDLSWSDGETYQLFENFEVRVQCLDCTDTTPRVSTTKKHSLTVQNLRKRSNYRFDVRAATREGPSPWSSPLTAIVRAATATERRSSTIGYNPLPLFSATRPPSNESEDLVTFGWPHGSAVDFDHDCGDQAQVDASAEAADTGEVYGRAEVSFIPFKSDAAAASIPGGRNCTITATGAGSTLSIPVQYRSETHGTQLIFPYGVRKSAAIDLLRADPPKDRLLGTLVIDMPTPPSGIAGVLRYRAVLSGGGVLRAYTGVVGPIRKIAFNAVPKGEAYWVCVYFDWNAPGGQSNAGCWGVVF